jgi:hypothetical protein
LRALKSRMVRPIERSDGSQQGKPYACSISMVVGSHCKSKLNALEYSLRTARSV